MTDLEIVRACADAMGLRAFQHYRMKDCIEVSEDGTGRGAYLYNPLTSDEQAMALVKRLELRIGHGMAKPLDLRAIPTSTAP